VAEKPAAKSAGVKVRLVTTCSRRPGIPKRSRRRSISRSSRGPSAAQSISRPGAWLGTGTRT